MNTNRFFNSRNLAFFLFGVITLSIICFGFYALPMSDDIDWYGHFKRTTFLKLLFDFYFSHTGRILTIFLYKPAFISLSNIPIVSSLMGAIFITFILYMCKFLPYIRKKGQKDYYLCSIFLISLWFYLRPFIPEIVFWVTGGLSYVLPFLMAVIWVRLLIYLKRAKNDSINLLIFISSFFLGTVHEQISCILLAVVFFIWLKNGNNFFKNKVTLSLCGGLVLGIVVAVGAPGNYVRMMHGNHSETVFFISNFFAVCFRVIDSTWKKAILAFLFGVIQVLYIKNSKSVKIFKRIPLIHWIVVFLGLALSSMLPFFVIGPQMAVRSLFFPVFFLSFMFMGIPYYFHEKLERIVEILRIERLLASICVIFVCTLFTFITIKDYIATQTFHKKLIKRVEIFKNPLNKNQDIIVKSIKKTEHSPLFFRELSYRKDHGINETLSKYYGVKSIKVVDE